MKSYEYGFASLASLIFYVHFAASEVILTLVLGSFPKDQTYGTGQRSCFEHVIHNLILSMFSDIQQLKEDCGYCSPAILSMYVTVCKKREKMLRLDIFLTELYLLRFIH